jgi:DnaJ-class molecular chaperone
MDGEITGREETCWWCGGSGVIHVTYEWHSFEQDGERDCEECGGRGLIWCSDGDES